MIMQKRKDFHSMTATEVSSLCLILINNVYYIGVLFDGLWYYGAVIGFKCQVVTGTIRQG